MKKKVMILLVALLFHGLTPGQSYGAYLFDTGTFDQNQGWSYGYDLMDDRNIVASQFSNDMEWIVGSIEGYFSGGSGHTQLQANIWGYNEDDPTIPGAELFTSATFTIVTGQSWQGIFGLNNWVLEEGTYWVGFTYVLGPNRETEGQSPALIYAGAQNSPDAALAGAQYGWGQWYRGDYDYNMRIASPVPEPATMLLLGLGLIGLAGVRRQMRK